MNVLLVEPGYENKYPPLGLMKLSTYHKVRGDSVLFVKGIEEFESVFDRIYISTLFTFDFEITVQTIRYYKRYAKWTKSIFVGGILASLLPEELKAKAGVDNVIVGLLDSSLKIGFSDKSNIDALIPDYSILETISYKYLEDSYFLRATRGCPNSCSFCAVPKLEPDFFDCNNIEQEIKEIDKRYGRKRNLLLMDNNILYSKKLPEIVESIRRAGFIKKPNYMAMSPIELANHKKPKLVQRFVDFNQGIDVRLITEENMELISSLPIKPLRIAFDSIKYEKQYVEAVRLAAKYKIREVSNYLLYNYLDKPEDLWKRMDTNRRLKAEYKIQLFSFPMRYSPVNSLDRNYVGKHWNPKFLRAIRAILVITHGIGSASKEYGDKVFGANLEEFEMILHMPTDFIIYRTAFEERGLVSEWEGIYKELNEEEKKELCAIVGSNARTENLTSESARIKKILPYYEITYEDAKEKHEIRREWGEHLHFELED